MFFDDNNQDNRRSVPRVSFREPVSFRFSEEEEAGGCLSQDLSEKGLKINLNHFVRPQTSLSLNFRLREASDLMTMNGRVAWAHRIPFSDRYQVGIEFRNTNDHSQQNIRQFVLSNQLN